MGTREVVSFVTCTGRVRLFADNGICIIMNEYF